jgi:hypothetical protein
MSQRDRHAESGAVVISRPVESTVAEQRELQETVALRREDHATSHATFDAKELLQKASELGLITCERPAAPAVTRSDSFRDILNGIMAARGLPAAPFVQPIDPFDSELDGTQRDAVARALQSPDLLLVQGLPGTGRTRVIAEIVEQIIARGMRVLILAPSSAAIDAVLLRLREPAARVTVRSMAREERSELLPSAIAAMTWVNQRQTERIDMLRRAVERIDFLEHELSRLREAASNWPQLREIVEKRENRDRERSSCRQRLDAIPGMVRGAVESVPNTTFGESLQRIAGIHDERRRKLNIESVDLQKQRLDRVTELRHAEERRETLRTLEAASHSSRFWSLNFWKARFSKSLPERRDEVQAEMTAAEAALKDLDARSEQMQQQLAACDSEFASEQSALIEAEIRRLASEIDDCLARLDELDREDTERFQHLTAGLAGVFGASDRAMPSSAELDAARASVAERICQLNKDLAFARCWREFVESNDEQLSRHGRSNVQCVAGPLSSLANDRWFADSAAFDLLLIDDAHLLAERDLLPAAKLAKRWVLVGEPAQPAPAVTRSRPAALNNPRRPRSAPDFFDRLWNLLHHETWISEGGRLCCRLHPVPAAERRFLEKESVADRADIELRIANPRTGQPFLAEVLFPASMSLAEAKEYLFHELGEIPCLSRVRTARWVDSADGPIFRINSIPAMPLPPSSVVLGPGLTMRAHDTSPCLSHSEVALSFSEEAGWDRARAEAWVNRHLLMRDSGRTCRLEQNYRHAPALGAWLNEAAFSGCRYPVEHAIEGAVQFEPVPRRSPAGGQRRGGAGFEIDLGDPNQRELLPVELAKHLPAQGCVNLPEAQAVADLAHRLPFDGSVVVTATYPAQVALLRLLCSPSAHVRLPEELAHRECDVLVLSLTRSHFSRAVTYGDNPVAMVQMLTRPRKRLVIAGDPGTLARRAQWEGAVDHLDEIAGERERQWVNALLRVLPIRSAPHARVAQGVKA